MRWISARDADRREGPRRFVESISRADPQPTLYFLHALLPHEPYMYLRSGQQFTEDPRLFGLQGSGRWVHEPWPVVQAYAQHLLQLQYVDTIVGRITARLKAEGFYDKALIIVTGDHGVSFRPGRPFKGVDRRDASRHHGRAALRQASRPTGSRGQRSQRAKHRHRPDDRRHLEDDTAMASRGTIGACVGRVAGDEVHSIHERDQADDR